MVEKTTTIILLFTWMKMKKFYKAKYLLMLIFPNRQKKNFSNEIFGGAFSVVEMT